MGVSTISSALARSGEGDGLRFLFAEERIDLRQRVWTILLKRLLTLLKTKMELQNHPLEKDNCLPNLHFWDSMFSFQGKQFFSKDSFYDLGNSFAGKKGR